MKNLKKVLALVLAVVMAFSLVTIASAAKLSDYKDASTVKQTEAVDVLSQAGVLAGSDGSFDPTGLFTREQAAKVITYLMLGTKVADKLTTTTSSFSDVAVDRWSAAYIQYCATAGVINGIGDGTFAPAANVTGAQFAKMLLTALGYGKNGEYVGANWEINTLKDAVSLEILTLDVDYTAAATREQIAQYALNALTLSVVVWDKTTDEYLPKALGGVNYFANKLNLVRTADVVSGVTGYTWTLNGNTVGFYGDESLIASDATGLQINQMTDKYGTWAIFYKASLDTTEGVNFFFNGAPIAAFSDEAAYDVGDLFVSNNDVYKISSIDGDGVITAAPYSVRGAVVNFINTDKDSKAETVSIIEKTAVQITGAPSVSFGSVKIPGMSFSGAPTVNEAKIKYPAGLVADDYILYYKDAGTGVFYVEKAQVVTGVATSSTNTFGVYSYNIGGTARKSSQLPGTVDGEDPAYFNSPFDYSNGGIDNAMQTSFNIDLDVVIDNGGNIIDFTAATNAAAASNYAVVLDAQESDALFAASDVKAQLLFTDGSVKIVTLGKIGTTNAAIDDATDLIGHFVTFKVADSGKYNVKVPEYATYIGAAQIDSAVKFINGAGIMGDSETVFLMPNLNTADTTDWVALKGIANAPATDGALATGVEFVQFTETGTAKFVLVNIASKDDLVTSPTQNVAYVIYDGLFVNYTIFPAKDGDPQYFEFKAIVDGKATTIKVDNSAYLGYTIAGAPGLMAIADADDDGYIDTTEAAIGATVGVGTAKAANGIIKLGGVGYTYNAETEVYFIDAFGGVTVKTVADIGRDTDDVVTAYLTQNENDSPDLLDAIYINVK